MFVSVRDCLTGCGTRGAVQGPSLPVCASGPVPPTCCPCPPEGQRLLREDSHLVCWGWERQDILLLARTARLGHQLIVTKLGLPSWSCRSPGLRPCQNPHPGPAQWLSLCGRGRGMSALRECSKNSPHLNAASPPSPSLSWNLGPLLHAPHLRAQPSTA